MIASDKLVIATYSLRKMLPVLLVSLTFGCIALFGWYRLMINPADFLHEGVFRTYALILGSICYLFWLPQLIWTLRQVFFVDRVAIWVKDGELIFMNRHFLKISCSEIAGISLEHFGRYQQSGIQILLKDGRKKVIPTGLLTVQAQDVERRLRGICLPILHEVKTSDLA